MTLTPNLLLTYRNIFFDNLRNFRRSPVIDRSIFGNSGYPVDRV
ncbi:MAG: hypothetical protein AB4290_17710 [Spirulina sp.]